MYTWYTIQTQYWLFDDTYVTVITLIPSQWIHQILGSVAIEDTPSFVGHLLHQVSDSAYWLHNHLQAFVLQNVLVDTLAEESISVSGRPMNHCCGQHISVYFCCRRSQQTQNSFQFNWPQYDLPACDLIVPISRFPGMWGREPIANSCTTALGLIGCCVSETSCPRMCAVGKPRQARSYNACPCHIGRGRVIIIRFLECFATQHVLLECASLTFQEKINSHSKFPHAMEVDLITQWTLYAKIYGHNVSTGIY